MAAYERQQYLLEKLRKEACLRVSEMASVLNVSESTIRNDLNVLEDEGRIRRIHGGAVLTNHINMGSNSFFNRYSQNLDEKRAIAKEAAKRVNNGDSILLDASSTAYCLACELSEHKTLRVITNGFEIAKELARNTSNNVILIGGVVNFNTSSVTGLLSEKIIEDLYVQKAFISCSGFTLERGMTELNLDEAQLKRKMIGSTQQLFAIVDSSKFGKEDLTPIAKLENIDKLYTDAGISPEWKERLTKVGIDIVVCDRELNTYDERANL